MLKVLKGSSLSFRIFRKVSDLWLLAIVLWSHLTLSFPLARLTISLVGLFSCSEPSCDSPFQYNRPHPSGFHDHSRSACRIEPWATLNLPSCHIIARPRSNSPWNSVYLWPLTACSDAVHGAAGTGQESMRGEEGWRAIGITWTEYVNFLSFHKVHIISGRFSECVFSHHPLSIISPPSILRLEYLRGESCDTSRIYDTFNPSATAVASATMPNRATSFLWKLIIFLQI